MAGTWYRLRKTRRSPRVIFSSLTVATGWSRFAGRGGWAAIAAGGAGGWARTPVGRTNPDASRVSRPDRIDARMEKTPPWHDWAIRSRKGRSATRDRGIIRIPPKFAARIDGVLSRSIGDGARRPPRSRESALSSVRLEDRLR